MRPLILDACCGSRAFWFNRTDSRAIFVDIRKESFELKDVSSGRRFRTLHIVPDVIADFTAQPFQDNTFALVVFDPPHLLYGGETGWMVKKYGKLRGDWVKMLREGFKECFRVLRPAGALIFKWAETDIPLSHILTLTNEKPLFGHRTGKQAKTHWVSFIKPPSAGPGS